MTYPGGKSGSGVYQTIINQIPQHTTYIETHLGGGAIMRHLKPAKVSIGIDIHLDVIDRWKSSNHAATFICADAVSWLKQYQFTGNEFIYCDPPYLMDTRKGGRLYQYEYTTQQHIELLALLVTLPCYVMVSGYPSALYDDLLRGWRTATFQAQTRSGSTATEQIWMNYPEPAQLHDYRYAGSDYRERERIKRKMLRWKKRLEKMDQIERQIILDALIDSNNSVQDKTENKLILSLFPGIDLFSKPFEKRGFCVVRGPDTIYGNDIRNFKAISNSFAGIIAGPPCQDFSQKRRSEQTGYGAEMINELKRVINEAKPDWYLVENVPGIPDIKIPGYTWQRFELDLGWYTPYSRLRHFQFGSKAGHLLNPPKNPKQDIKGTAVLATDERSFSEMKHIQGLEENFDLPSFTLEGKKRAVGNAVPYILAEVVADLISVQVYQEEPAAIPVSNVKDDARRCLCECGRVVVGKALYFSAACRKRAQRRREIL